MKCAESLVILGFLCGSPVNVSRAADRSYRAEISAPDRVNSRGTALKTLREFLRQDRFNVHSERHVDPGDTLDPMFGSVEARGLIDGARLVMPEGLEASVISGRVNRLEVEVSGSGKNLEMRLAVAKETPESGSQVTTMKGKDLPATEGGPAGSAGVQVTYLTTLGPRDFVNSNGVDFSRLRDFLIQDRSNVNMLGRRDPGDEKDMMFITARQRRVFETATLLVDPALANPLLSRQPVAISVSLTGDHRLLVTRPGAPPDLPLRSLEEMVQDRNRTVAAIVRAGDGGAEVALRELVALAELAHGRQHEKPLIFRVTLAQLLLRQDRVSEVIPMLALIEEDFRAAAHRGVEALAIFPVMGFLAEAYTAAGKFDAATRLLGELLDEPGKGKWKLDEAQRSDLEELRRLLKAPSADGAPTDKAALD